MAIMKKFYITTAIAYVNSSPHLGFGYELILADSLARWHRLLGEDVFFLTGTDENAQTNVKAAKEANIPIRQFVDKNVEKFKNLCKKLNISNNYFIRTTDKNHVNAAQLIFKKIYDNKDIYLGNYEGFYCTSCEAFYLEKDLVDKKCPVHKKELDFIKEESYFFRLSKYEKQILGLLSSKDFVVPESKRKELINRIKKDGLKDLSVSRKALDWGVDVPFDKSHKIYVWIDALGNYLSAIGYPNGTNFKKYWPADVHLIGKDISWFHSVIWPAILLSAEVKVPKKILIHGFVNLKGQKLSKTTGTIIDPIELVEKYGLDSLRYFLIREIPFGEDGDFSEEALKNRINNELANDLGNLLSRVLTICEKNFKGKIGKNEIDSKLSNKLNLEKINELMSSYRLTEALNEIWTFVKACNKHINDEKLWEMQPKEQEKHLYSLLECLRIISLLLSSFIPETSAKIYMQLGISCNSFKDAKFGLIKQYMVKKGPILFNKIK